MTIKSTKKPAVSQDMVDAFVANGGTIKYPKSRKVVRHNLKSTARGVYRSRV